MASLMLKWSNLFNMPEVDFEGVFPPKITVEEDIQLTIAWLTAADRHNRKLLRCDALGALLMSDPWNGFNSVETGTLEVDDSTADTVTFTTGNVGVLISTGANLVKLTFKRVNGGADEVFYAPHSAYFWYPHPCYSVVGRCEPYTTGGAAVHGVTAFN